MAWYTLMYNTVQSGLSPTFFLFFPKIGMSRNGTVLLILHGITVGADSSTLLKPRASKSLSLQIPIKYFDIWIFLISPENHSLLFVLCCVLTVERNQEKGGGTHSES